jgi:hypothetical protein
MEVSGAPYALGRYVPGERRCRGARLIGARMRPAAGLNAMEEEKICSCWEMNPDSSIL